MEEGAGWLHNEYLNIRSNNIVGNDVIHKKQFFGTE